MGWLSRVVNGIEETLIALLLGLMTIVTFANVVARFGFNSNILWALELTVFMFGWLVLLGASYAVKTNGHLGVDAILNIVPTPVAKALGFLSIGCCLLFTVFLMKGAYDYWAVFADLPPTTGRWFPTGIAESFRSQSFYEVDDIPMIEPLRFLEPWLLYPEDPPFEKLPKAVPYLVLPLSMLLLFFRFAQAAWAMAQGKIDRIVASHEVEDELEALKAEGETK